MSDPFPSAWSNRLTVADVVLTIALTISIIAFGWQRWLAPEHTGDVAEIWVAGKLFERVPLDRPTHYQIHGKLGMSDLEVKNGGIRFVSSPCLHRYCVRAGWLKSIGAIAICLPNAISIEVRDQKSTPSSYDSINF